MTDDELLAALREIFASETPDVDRSDGYGDEYTFTGFEIAPGADGFDDLVVTVDRGGQTLTSRLLVDREWREASGLDDARSYATFVTARWAEGVVDDTPETVGRTDPDPDPEQLEDALRRAYGNANRVRHGVVEVVEEDGEIFLLHATPGEWRRFVATRPDALSRLDATIGSRWDDEQHVVIFRGDLHASVRAQLPPLRSLLLRDPSADD